MYQLIIAEKPSVAQSIAAVLGAKRRDNGYLAGFSVAGSVAALDAYGVCFHVMEILLIYYCYCYFLSVMVTF